MYEMKGERAAGRSSFGSIMQRRLSDITNFIPQPKSPSIAENLVPDAASAKEFINHLVKEKTALMKLVQDKNKIIEVSGTEIHNLRNCLQKMQLQNWSLAQANSHMLAEIDLGKERLKTFEHEIICKEVLLKAKNSQLKEQEEVKFRKLEFQKPNTMEFRINDQTRTCNASRGRRSTRSLSMGSSTISLPHIEKEVAVSKRYCLRRQSARSRIKHEVLAADNLFEIDEAMFVRGGVESTHNSCVSSDLGGGEVRRRSCVGRPLRRAAEKVQSYKERPVNVKMRRPE